MRLVLHGSKIELADTVQVGDVCGVRSCGAYGRDGECTDIAPRILCQVRAHGDDRSCCGRGLGAGDG